MRIFRISKVFLHNVLVTESQRTLRCRLQYRSVQIVTALQNAVWNRR